MSEQPEELGAGLANDYAHILDDLHAVCRELAAVRAMLEGFAGRLDALDELMPAARRAAAMLDTPVTAFLAARKEANGGERLVGTGPGESRRGRARAARRKLPDARLRRGG